jgi:hypothetical protein
MYLEVEFEDEIDVHGSTYYTLVEVEASGEVDKEQNVTNIKILSIHDKDNDKAVALKDLDSRETRRLLEKAEDKIITKFIYEGGPSGFDHDGYDDNADYYDGNLASIQSSSED